ncbi:MAG: rane protein-like protein [Polaromonas sp.]|nr:rane protein-like protein [Polaromonas sp.]
MNKATRIDATRWLALGSMMGLIVLGLAWEMWLAPIRPGGSLLALKVLPLCLPLAGVLKNRMYTYRWLSLMVWVYFTEGATRAWSDKPPGNYLAMVEVLLCLLLFAACAFHVRLRLKNAGPLVPAAEPA